jgi:hypothetical protein
LRDAPPLDPARVLPRQAEVSARTVTPEQAVGEAVRVAAPRQAGLAPLFADAEQAVEANALPARVRAAATDLLSLRLPLDAQLTGPDVKQAFIRSGVLFEGRVASTTDLAQATRSIAAPSPQNAAPAPADDLKAALLVFRQVLKTWAAREPAIRTAPPTPSNAAADVAAPPAASTTIAAIKVLANALAAPSRSAARSRHAAVAGAGDDAGQDRRLGVVIARDAVASTCRNRCRRPAAALPRRAACRAGAAAPSIAPDASPREIADRLIAQTDGALARQTLLQVASLPDQPDVPRADAAQRWNFEIPFATPQGTSIAQFEVSRDGRARRIRSATRDMARAFLARRRADGAGACADRPCRGAHQRDAVGRTRLRRLARLQETAPLLNDALRAAELEPADLQLRVGAPPALRQAAPGRFMDRAS